MSVNGILTGQNTQRVKPVTSDQYDSLSSEAKAADILYAITDDEPPSDVSYSKSQVDSLVSNIKDDIAGIQATGETNETGSVITNGTYFYLNNVLVRAIADIGNDATFSLNVNYEEVTAGGLNELVDSKVSIVGKGINLLRNWYFSGGGSQQGGQQFPINQRGQTSYSGQSYAIDGWVGGLSTSSLTINYNSVGFTAGFWYQYIEGIYTGHSMSLSILCPDGNYYYGTGMVPQATSSNQIVISVTLPNSASLTLLLSPQNKLFVRLAGQVGNVSAIKLEHGKEATLGTLYSTSYIMADPIPDYEAELIKCQTSTADSSDTYANKSLATEQQLAYVETGTTASRAYNVNDWFCWGGSLYRAITSISSGDDFILGTNCTGTSILNEFIRNGNARYVQYYKTDAAGLVTHTFSQACMFLVMTIEIGAQGRCNGVYYGWCDSVNANNNHVYTIFTPTSYAPTITLGLSTISIDVLRYTRVTIIEFGRTN